MTMQLDLFKPRQPKVTTNEVETLVSYLDICTGWKTAKELAKVTGHSDRKLRALANASEGRIVTGQRGYMAASNATSDEISHAANWLEHQAREMIRRATAIRNMAHRRLAT